jgi:hypothetical protein
LSALDHAEKRDNPLPVTLSCRYFQEFSLVNGVQPL